MAFNPIESIIFEEFTIAGAGWVCYCFVGGAFPIGVEVGDRGQGVGEDEKVIDGIGRVHDSFGGKDEFEGNGKRSHFSEIVVKVTEA